MILRQKLSRTVYLQYKRVFAGAGRVSATQLSITPDSTFLQNSVEAARVLQGANEGTCDRGRDAGKVRAVPRYEAKKIGANDRNRTDDLLITSELLYRLSYIGTMKSV